MDDADPFDLFQRWHDEAAGAQAAKPHAMAVSTTGPDGRPASRMVLMSSFDRRGFVFHTTAGTTAYATAVPATAPGAVKSRHPGRAPLNHWRPLS